MLVELGGLLVVDRGDLGEEGGLFSWVFDGVVVVVEVGLPEQLQFVKDISLHILFQSSRVDQQVSQPRISTADITQNRYIKSSEAQLPSYSNICTLLPREAAKDNNMRYAGVKQSQPSESQSLRPDTTQPLQTIKYSNNINRSMQQSKLQDPQADHRIDMLMLSIIFVGFFSCLIRTDYNFIIIFFCYFIWQYRKDALALTIITGALILLFVVDLLFALTEIPVWTSPDNINEVWQTIRPLHNFGVFCFVVINILKIILVFYTCRASRAAKAQPA